MGGGGVPLVLTRTHSTGDQAQLCFAVARLLYRSKVSLPRGALLGGSLDV